MIGRLAVKARMRSAVVVEVEIAADRVAFLADTEIQRAYWHCKSVLAPGSILDPKTLSTKQERAEMTLEDSKENVLGCLTYIAVLVLMFVVIGVVGLVLMKIYW